MLTHFGPKAFFLSVCFLPSLMALARNSGVTIPQVSRSHCRRLLGSSRSASLVLAPDSSEAWGVTSCSDCANALKDKLNRTAASASRSLRQDACCIVSEPRFRLELLAVRKY